MAPLRKKPLRSPAIDPKRRRTRSVSAAADEKAPTTDKDSSTAKGSRLQPEAMQDTQSPTPPETLSHKEIFGSDTEPEDSDGGKSPEASESGEAEWDENADTEAEAFLAASPESFLEAPPESPPAVPTEEEARKRKGFQHQEHDFHSP